MFPVIQDFRKDLRHSPGHGYGRNRGAAHMPQWVADRPGTPESEIVHSTNNGNKGTKFENEAKFLRDSPFVSCHDLIGKDGTVAEILPALMLAWHSGTVRPGFSNGDSVGTELHISIGEKPTEAQIASLTWRIQQRREQYGTVKERIDTHRAVALPKGRKSDPEGWDDSQFYQWREGLYAVDWPALWGSHFPYWPTFGIPSRWRQEHATKPLGKAMTGEMTMVDGRLVQGFEQGAVWYRAGETGVWR